MPQNPQGFTKVGFMDLRTHPDLHSPRCNCDPNLWSGETACAINIFYWDFLRGPRPLFEDLGRMGVVLSHLPCISVHRLDEIAE
jgi:deoxyribodipyrimidine photolyase-like uncharacterized protein